VFPFGKFVTAGVKLEVAFGIAITGDAVHKYDTAAFIVIGVVRRLFTGT
jgi:hypothetical protein